MKTDIVDFPPDMPPGLEEAGFLKRLLQTDNSAIPESYWRSLTYFNVYRGAVAVMFFLTLLFFRGQTAFGSEAPRFFFATCSAYFLSSLLFAWMISKRSPAFPLQLQLQVLSDIICLAMLMYSSGGVKSGIGLMLLISMMAAGLVSRGRIALFHAAAATICVLFAEFYRELGGESSTGEYVQSGMLSSGFFVTAWLAHMLARYSQESAQLAARRGKDLLNMAQVNQLVIQDLSDGVLVIDGEGTVRSANRQAENYLGSVLTRPSVKLREVSLELTQRLERWRVRPQEKFSPLQALLQNVSLETRFVSIGVSEPKPTVIFLRDLSLQQNAAQQIKLAAMGRLTASIAHEIRNPLSSINHAAELLQEGEHLAPTDARLIEIIRDNSLRLDRMVQEVLNLN
ncbi:MAG: histidine kinase dimerization/phospho-acceptor domain-containing protein, partial [Burkholderiales bacterium]